MSNCEDKCRWEHFEHKADVGIRGFGRSKAEAFAQAAVALTAVITEPEQVEARTAVKVKCSGEDDEMLFVEWLSSLLYEMSTRGMLFGRFDVEIRDGNLKATAWGEKIDAARHSPTVEVKAATYSELSVRQDDEGKWIAQCVVDV